MTKTQAREVAKGLSRRGLVVEFEQTGGDVWVVTVGGDRGHFVVITDEVVTEYKARRHWDAGLTPVKRIDLVAYGRHL